MIIDNKRLLPIVQAISAKIEFAEALLFIFVLTIVRQYFWIVPVNIIAWILTFFSVCILFSIHYRFKERVIVNGDSSKPLFTAVVILPLLLIYFLRGSIPDTNYDTINYHITIAERALRGFPYIKNDFFPTGLHTLPPAPSMFLGIFRHILGYRGGTLGNLLLLIWTAVITDRFLVPLIGTSWKRYVLVLMIISCEYALLEVNIYMVDLLGVPLLLEALWLVSNLEKIRNKNYYIFYISLLLGLSAAMKLTNLAFVIPIVAAVIVTVMRSDIPFTPQAAVCSLAALVVPSLPYSIYMYAQTASPLFPFFNNIFKSPYWELSNFKDLRWGPGNVLEIISWPVMTVFVPKRISELQVYSGRLALSFVAALVYLFSQKKDRLLPSVWLASVFLWSITTGYIRYALFLEMLGGIILVYTLYSSASMTNRMALQLKKLLFFGLIIQVMLSYSAVYRVEWSWRSTVLRNTTEHFNSFKYFLRDYSIKKYIKTDNGNVMEEPEVWAVCCRRTAAFATLFNPNIPMINIAEDNFFTLPKASEKFSGNLEDLKTKRIFAVCSSDELQCCKDNIGKRNFTIGKTVPVGFSYFGHSYCTVYLIEVFF